MKQVRLLAPLCFLLANLATAQEFRGHRVFNITFDTSSPDRLVTSHGRILWREIDQAGGGHRLRYFSGAEIFTLDSALADVTADLGDDVAAWVTPAESLKIFDIRSWSTAVIGPAYNPNGGEPVSLGSGNLAYARRVPGSGTEVVMRRVEAGSDTAFRASVWNRLPSTHHGQLAWVTSDSDAPGGSVSVVFFDGLQTRILALSPGTQCSGVRVRDGQVVWREDSAGVTRIREFSGNSVRTLVMLRAGNMRLAGYGLDGGLAVAGIVDTTQSVSTLTLYDAGSDSLRTIVDSTVVSHLHVRGDRLILQSGTGPSRVLVSYGLATGVREEIAAGEAPVSDGDDIAWTFGDAVELRVPVISLQLSSGYVGGWEQTRFVCNDGLKVLWGDFTASLNARMFASDGGAPLRLTDSVDYKDFLMANDGWMIWRHDFNAMYLTDGASPPELIVDSLQCENMYMADEKIGFHGFRVDDAAAVQQSWLYDISSRQLSRLTDDSSQTVMNTITLVDGNTVCWMRSTDTENMLMIRENGQTRRLTDSLVGNKFGMRNGRLVWSERRADVQQVFSMTVPGGMPVQLTSGSADCVDPVTDGSAVAWIELSGQSAVLVYRNPSSGRTARVAHVAYPSFRWSWMSNGRIAWSGDGEIHVFDGKGIRRLSNTGDFTPNTEPYVDDEYVVWKRDNPIQVVPRRGDVYRGTLVPHADFDARHIVGPAPLGVRFSNRSWEGNRSHLWDFGDGESSVEENPIHTYTMPGSYTVTLDVTGPAGHALVSKRRLVRVGPPVADVVGPDNVPRSFVLHQNYPNPFNPSTTIAYDIPVPSRVTITVYDLLGRRVATLASGDELPGGHEVSWNAGDRSSGVYIVRLLAVPKRTNQGSGGLTIFAEVSLTSRLLLMK